ncbi:GNAT family N-acetyltransferase [Streptomonospora sediminis]
MDLEVTDVPARKRYEARTGGTVAGFAEYQLTDELAVLTHTEVDPGYEGQGVGGELVRGALDDVRRRGLAVLPVCPFVKGWIERHPDYTDLVYQSGTGGAGGTGDSGGHPG